VTAESGSYTTVIGGNSITFDRNGDNHIIADSGTSANLNLTAGNRIVSSADSYHAFKTGSTPTESMRLTSTGLGIGTSAPATALEVKSDGASIQVSSADYDVALLGRRGSSGVDLDKGYMRLKDTGTTTVAIDSAGNSYFNGGNVGIGTSSPSYALHVATNAGFTAEFQNTAGVNHRPVKWTDNTGATVGTLGADFTANEFILQAKDKPLVFGTGTSSAERARIDSSGNVLVGKTSTSGGVVGTVLSSTGLVRMTASNIAVAEINRINSDGSICDYKRDGTTVGSIGVAAGDNLYIGGSATDHTGLVFPDNAILPAKELSAIDAFVDLGSTTRRFKDLYLSNSAYVKNLGGVSDPDTYINLGDTANTIKIFTGGSEAMRIDSAGNVSIPNGDLTVGSFAKFHGTSELFLDSGASGTNKTGLRFETNGLLPRKNFAMDAGGNVSLGNATYKFSEVFAVNGTINTSDRNEKQDIESLTEAEERVAVAAKSLLKKFRWKDAVEAKGDDARIHFGIIAQDLQAAFEAEGLDAGRYGMFTSNTWWEHDVEVPAIEAVEGVEGVATVEAQEAVMGERQKMETVETGTYVNLDGETITETQEVGVTEDVVQTVVERQDIDGVMTEVEVEKTVSVPVMESYEVSPAVEAVAGVEAVEAVKAADAYTRTDTYNTAEEAPEGSVEKTRMGVRYSELLAFIISAI
jgi:hypothetical protein